MQRQSAAPYSTLKADSEQHAESLLMKLAVTSTAVDGGIKSSIKSSCYPRTQEHQSTADGGKPRSLRTEGVSDSGKRAAKDRFYLGSNEGQCTQTEYFKGSLEAMLAEQRKAVERALAFSTMIGEQLAKERSLSPCTDITEQVMKQEAPTVNSAVLEASPGQHPSNLRKGERVPEVERLSVSNHPRRDSLLKFGDDVESNLSEPLLSEDGMTSSKKSDFMLLERPISDTSQKMSIRDVLPEVSNLKAKVLKMMHLSQQEYHAEDYYKESGLISKIAKDHCFHNLTLMVIVMNTLWIAIDTDLNHAPTMAQASLTFKIMDNFFCGFFTFEMSVRFFAFKSKYYAFTDPGFLFDGFLVALMIWDTWVTSLLYLTGHFCTDDDAGKAGSVLRIFRVFRLMRLARAGRLFKSVPELMVLAKGMAVAVRSVVVVLSLLALIIYIFSIVFTQLLADTKVDHKMENSFQTVPASANFLLLQVLCGFDSDFANSLLQEGFVMCYGLFLIYLLLGSLTIMNMLIGILCDVVTRTADDEKEEAFQAAMEAQVDTLTESLDISGRGHLVRHEFQEGIQRPEVILSLNEMGVDVAALMDFAHFVFDMSEEVSYTNFHHMVVQFRGGKEVCVKDIMDMRKQMSKQFVALMEVFERTGKEKGSMFDGLDSFAVGDIPSRSSTPVQGNGNSKQLAETEVVCNKDDLYLRDAISPSCIPILENTTSPSLSVISPSDCHFSEASESLDTCAPHDSTLPTDHLAVPSATACKQDPAASASSLHSLDRQTSPKRTKIRVPSPHRTREAAAALAAQFAEAAAQP